MHGGSDIKLPASVLCRPVSPFLSDSEVSDDSMLMALRKICNTQKLHLAGPVGQDEALYAEHSFSIQQSVHVLSGMH